MASDSHVKELTTLKREIRALLISCKHGCTPKQLEDDYLQVMGECIPYHYMGHSNFMSFIYSIPDVVSVCRSRNNVTLYGVADHTTKKIKDLVSKQKSRAYSSNSFTPRMSMVTQNTRVKPKEAAVPPIFKTRLKELMSSYPNGIALKFFNEAFAKRFHHYIAFQNWGFSSLEAMVEAVPEILMVHNNTARNIKMVRRVSPPRQETPQQNRQAGEEGAGHSLPPPPPAAKGDNINWYSLEQNRSRQHPEKPDNPPQPKPTNGGEFILGLSSFFMRV